MLPAWATVRSHWRLGFGQIHFAEDAADFAGHEGHRFGELLAGLGLLLDEHGVFDRQELAFEHFLDGGGFFEGAADELVLPLVADFAGVLGVADEIVGEFSCWRMERSMERIPPRIFISRSMRRSSLDLNRPIFGSQFYVVGDNCLGIFSGPQPLILSRRIGRGG